MRFVQIISVIAEKFGGPSVTAIGIHRAMLARGHDSVLLAGAYADERGGRLTGNEVARLNAIAGVRLLPARRPHAVQYSRGLKWAVQEAVWGADLVHIHGQYMAVHAASYYALRRASVLYGVQPHGTMEPYQSARHRGRKSAYDLLLGRRLLRGADYFLFAAAREATRAVPYVPEERRVIAALGIQLDAPTEVVELSETIGSSSREECFLFLGRFAKKKRPDLLLRAWASARRPPGAKLLLVGPGDHWSRGALKSLVAEYGVGESVIVWGPLSGGEKTWLMERCGHFALPSENENFGIAVAEAMQAGCRILVTEEVGASDHVRAAAAGRVVQGTTEAAWVACLEEAFAMERREVDASSIRARAYARTTFRWERVASALEDRVIRGS